MQTLNSLTPIERMITIIGGTFAIISVLASLAEKKTLAVIISICGFLIVTIIIYLIKKDWISISATTDETTDKTLFLQGLYLLLCVFMLLFFLAFVPNSSNLSDSDRRATLVYAATLTKEAANFLAELEQRETAESAKYTQRAVKKDEVFQTALVTATAIARHTETANATAIPTATYTPTATRTATPTVTPTPTPGVDELLLTGYAYLDSGFHELAIVTFTTVIDRAPERAEAYAGRGSAYYGQFNYQKAIEDYRAAIDLDLDNSVFYTELGKIYFENGAYKEAELNYIEAIDLDGSNADAWLGLARVYDEWGAIQAAYLNYLEYVELAGSNADPYAHRRIRELENCRDLRNWDC